MGRFVRSSAGPLPVCIGPGERGQQLPTVPKRDSELLQIAFAQQSQGLEVDVVCGEDLRVLLQTELLEPPPNVLHQSSGPACSGPIQSFAPDRSSLAQLDSCKGLGRLHGQLE